MTNKSIKTIDDVYRKFPTNTLTKFTKFAKPYVFTAQEATS